MSAAGGIAWLARHELRLTWRDLAAMLTGGRRGRAIVVVAVMAVVALLLHALAATLVGSGAGQAGPADLDRWITVTALLALAFSLIASQAMESVTRAFYSRSDLDLVLSSPVSVRRVFAVRTGAIAASTTTLSLLLGAPLINVLAWRDGPGWLMAYPVLLAIGVVATVLSLSLTFLMFGLVGARRTRLVAQVVAALVGATFIIGIQLAAISSMGTLSRMTFLTSDLVRAHMPGEASIAWLPARAVTGEALPALGVIGAAALLFAAAVMGLSGGFGEKVAAAAGVGQSGAARPVATSGFRQRSARAALRRKEWKLLARDHWLVSQTLMQVFYLVPPAFMLWKGFGGSGAVPSVVVPVLVMACGQLAGGLAWLAISGEDAPQLVASAPVTPAMVLRAKIEAVFAALALAAAPILAVMAWVSPWSALICLCGIAAAAASATAIQLWFRTQARRSNFRRRQTSSRVATFAEAFSSIFWAGAAGLWAYGSALAVPMALGALGVLAAARALRGRPEEAFA